MSPVVLITTANTPPQDVPYLKMTNVAKRIIAAKASVFYWAAQQVEKIVIADATGSTLLNADEISMLRSMDVFVEQISYQQDAALIKERGKGYGEGALIQFALDNSQLLRKEEGFFKCTGKVICRNFPAIQDVVLQNNISNIFWRHLGEGDSLQPWADARFFYASKKFAKDFLVPAYLKADDKVAACEYHIFNLLNENFSTAKTLRPSLSGFAGGTNGPYFDLSLGNLDLNAPCWIKMGA